MYSFDTNNAEFKAELNELVRQFYHANFMRDFSVVHILEINKTVRNFVQVNGRKFSFCDEAICQRGKYAVRRILLRTAKLSLYKALSATLERSLPWGALTGVRPTKLAYELLNCGVNVDFISESLQKNYLISSPKADLVQSILLAQRNHLENDESFVNLYVHIPFCPSRCYYCSFVSSTIEKQKKFVEPYILALEKEIVHSLRLIKSLGKRIHSVYVGGGTPTSISDFQLERILSSIDVKGVELTVEAGRPETITRSKFDIMKMHNVTRISVNPQSFDENVLRIIGRGHSLKDFFDAYNLAKEFGFIINTDLIAGLKSETVSGFIDGLEQLIKLTPHNITIHTLSQKRGSILKEEELNALDKSVIKNEYLLAEEMLERAYEKLAKANYIPYYLYRQKLMLANLENVGFSLPSFQCVNNITTMEESLSVIACGAGAISKRIIKSKNDDGSTNVRIERYPNLKDINLYLEQFDERLAKKELFYEN